MFSSDLPRRACARTARWLALAALLAVAGCAAVGPDYARPELALPDRWSRAVDTVPASAPDASVPRASQNEPQAGGLALWWRSFDDPLLVVCVEQALRGTPDLRAALARLAAARAQRESARAQLAPVVTAGASARYGAIGDAQGVENYSLGLDAAWELDLFGARRRAIEAADADLGAAAATLAATRVSLAAEVALTYIEVRSLQARIDVARRNLDSQGETLQLTRWRAQAGLVGTLDVEQARANYEQTRGQIPVLEALLGQARHRLSVLMGLAPAALDAQLAAPAPVPAAPARIALAIPAAVLRQRPDVEAAERALAAETARVGVAEAARYPSLSLGASIGLEALTPSRLFDPGTTVRSLFASFAGTVFDAGRLRQQVEIRSAVQAQALANYESVVLAALEEVENALLAIAASRDRREALAAAVDAARNAALLARHRYASGLTDFQTVLDSGRTVRTLEDALASSDADAANAIVRLYKALGGGWSAAAAATADQDIEARQ